jgi:predicted nucleic acid-binding protein
MTAPLSVADLVGRLKNQPLSLAFDTNAVFRHRRFFAVCDAVSQLNEDRPSDPVRLSLCAVVYGEKLHDMRCEHDSAVRGPFDEAAILRVLAQKKVEVCAFAREHAAQMSALLYDRYPDQASWHAAKRALYIQRLGAQHLDAQIPGRQRCSATSDWLVAAHAALVRSVLVTTDQGTEFQDLADRAKLADLEQALQQLGLWSPRPARE